MLQNIALNCCIELSLLFGWDCKNDQFFHATSCCMKKLIIFKFEPTTRCNRVAQRVQHALPNNVAIFCFQMLPWFGWGFQ